MIFTLWVCLHVYEKCQGDYQPHEGVKIPLVCTRPMVDWSLVTRNKLTTESRDGGNVLPDEAGVFRMIVFCVFPVPFRPGTFHGITSFHWPALESVLKLRPGIMCSLDIWGNQEGFE